MKATINQRSMSPDMESASDSEIDGNIEVDAESEVGWEELEPDSENVLAQDLFNAPNRETTMCDRVEDLVEHTKRVWGVDLVKLRRDLSR